MITTLKKNPKKIKLLILFVIKKKSKNIKLLKEKLKNKLNKKYSNQHKPKADQRGNVI